MARLKVCTFLNVIVSNRPFCATIWFKDPSTETSVFSLFEDELFATEELDLVEELLAMLLEDFAELEDATLDEDFAELEEATELDEATEELDFAELEDATLELDFAELLDATLEEDFADELLDAGEGTGFTDQPMQRTSSTYR